MKRLQLLIILFITLIAFSCEKEFENEEGVRAMVKVKVQDFSISQEDIHKSQSVEDYANLKVITLAARASTRLLV